MDRGTDGSDGSVSLSLQIFFFFFSVPDTLSCPFRHIAKSKRRHPVASLL